MAGTVERNRIMHSLRSQLRFCLILIESRIQLLPELVHLDVQQEPICSYKA